MIVKQVRRSLATQGSVNLAQQRSVASFGRAYLKASSERWLLRVRLMVLLMLGLLSLALATYVLMAGYRQVAKSPSLRAILDLPIWILLPLTFLLLASTILVPSFTYGLLQARRLGRRSKLVLEGLGLDPSCQRVLILLSDGYSHEPGAHGPLDHSRESMVAWPELEAADELRRLVERHCRTSSTQLLRSLMRGVDLGPTPSVSIWQADSTRTFQRSDAVIALGHHRQNRFISEMQKLNLTQLNPSLIEVNGNPTEYRDEALRLPDEWFSEEIEPPYAYRIQVRGFEIPTIWTRELDGEREGYKRDTAIVENVLPQSDGLPGSALVLSGLSGQGTYAAARFVAEHVFNFRVRYAEDGAKWRHVLAWFVAADPTDFEAPVSSEVGILWPPEARETSWHYNQDLTPSALDRLN